MRVATDKSSPLGLPYAAAPAAAFFILKNHKNTPYYRIILNSQLLVLNYLLPLRDFLQVIEIFYVYTY